MIFIKKRIRDPPAYIHHRHSTRLDRASVNRGYVQPRTFALEKAGCRPKLAKQARIPYSDLLRKQVIHFSSNRELSPPPSCLLAIFLAIGKERRNSRVHMPKNNPTGDTFHRHLKLTEVALLLRDVPTLDVRLGEQRRS